MECRIRKTVGRDKQTPLSPDNTLGRMNCLLLRDKLLSDLHATALKPLGYRKKGHWLIREIGDLIHTFYLRASRSGTQDEARFWIDVQIFSADWHRLVFPERPYKGPSEGPSLVLRELGEWCAPPLKSLVISGATDVDRLLEQLCVGAGKSALPYLAQRESTHALLAMLIAEPEPGTELCLVGLSRLLGLETQAREHMQRAKQNAVHDNELRFLELRERNIWRNAA